MKTSDALRGLKVTNECFLHDSAHPAIPLMMKPGVLHHRVIENYAFAPLVVTRKLPGGIVYFELTRFSDPNIEEVFIAGYERVLQRGIEAIKNRNK